MIGYNLNNFYPLEYFFFTGANKINPHNVLWPIKSEIITANTQGRINQNIGYVGADLNEAPLDIITDED
jgi:hypothetical protein